MGWQAETCTTFVLHVATHYSSLYNLLTSSHLVVTIIAELLVLLMMCIMPNGLMMSFILLHEMSCVEVM